MGKLKLPIIKPDRQGRTQVQYPLRMSSVTNDRLEQLMQHTGLNKNNMIVTCINEVYRLWKEEG